jgi:hypothetical protein
LVSFEGNVGGIVALPGVLEWVDFGSGELRRCTLPSCQDPSTLAAPAGAELRGIATDGQRAYFTNRLSDGAVLSCPVAGCDGGPSTVAGQLPGLPQAIAVDDASVYFTVFGNKDDVFTCAKTGCTNPALIYDGTGNEAELTAVSVDSVNVYWTDMRGRSVYGSAKADASLASAIVVGEPGGEDSPGPVFAGGDAVFWADLGNPDAGIGGSVKSCPGLACQSPRTLATNQPLPAALTGDATAIYWVNAGNGSVMKLAR